MKMFSMMRCIWDLNLRKDCEFRLNSKLYFFLIFSEKGMIFAYSTHAKGEKRMFCDSDEESLLWSREKPCMKRSAEQISKVNNAELGSDMYLRTDLLPSSKV
jgi:hypothetical protein